MKATNFDSKEVREKDEVPTIYIELCDKRKSGFILDGTRGTKNEAELDAPTARFIPNVGFRLAKGVNPETGKEEWYNEEIRYIKNRREISVKRQKELGISPAKVSIEDKIIIKGGNMVVAREGNYIGLYDFIMQAFYNETNPDKPSHLPGIYKIVEVDEESDELNEHDLHVANAVAFVAKFYKRLPNKQFKYNEEKIDALCNLFNIYAETYSQKVTSLNASAKMNPIDFLEMAEKFEQTTITEISHALEMGVIRIEKGVFSYTDREKILFTSDEKIKKKDDQIESLADWFRTTDGNAEYTEFRAYLDAAKEKSLQTK